MTTWKLNESPAGNAYLLTFDGVAPANEAVDFGYRATLDTGTLDVPDSVALVIASDYGDTASAIKIAGSIVADTNGYSVGLVLPSARTDTMAGDWVYEIRERRDTASYSYPYGGQFHFDARVEG